MLCSYQNKFDLIYFLEVLKQRTSLTLGFVDVMAVGWLGRRTIIMGFSVEDRLLIKNLFECKGYGANKNWLKSFWSRLESKISEQTAETVSGVWYHRQATL